MMGGHDFVIISGFREPDGSFDNATPGNAVLDTNDPDAE